MEKSLQKYQYPVYLKQKYKCENKIFDCKRQVQNYQLLSASIVRLDITMIRSCCKPKENPVNVVKSTLLFSLKKSKVIKIKEEKKKSNFLIRFQRTPVEKISFLTFTSCSEKVDKLMNVS